MTLLCLKELYPFLIYFFTCFPAGWYERTRRLNWTSLYKSLRNFISVPSLKRRFPLPRTTGWTKLRYTSMRLCCINVCTRSGLPQIKMSWPGCCIIFEISSGIFHFVSLELFHLISCRIVETTNLERQFTLSALFISHGRPGWSNTLIAHSPQ